MRAAVIDVLAFLQLSRDCATIVDALKQSREGHLVAQETDALLGMVSKFVQRATQPDRAGDRDAFALDQPLAQRVWARSDLGAYAQAVRLIRENRQKDDRLDRVRNPRLVETRPK